MRYTEEIEQTILRQIEQTPDREIILPDWAYWAGRNQPMIYDGDEHATPLIRHLYEIVVGPLEPQHRVLNPTGVDKRNINPLLARRMLGSVTVSCCSKGHEYTDADFIPNVGYRCQTCAEQKRQWRLAHPIPERDFIAENREKTHCPQGHPYNEENTLNLKNGRRRCRICNREQTKRARARQKENR